MWLVVIAALILPFRPQSDFAATYNTAKVQEISYQSDYYAAKSEYQEIRQIENPTPEQTQKIAAVQSQTRALQWKMVVFDYALPLIWFVGMIAFMIFMLLGGSQLNRKIKSSKIFIDDDRYARILQKCKEQLHVTRNIKVVMQSHIKTPAICGLFQPKIILPKYVKDLSDESLTYVMLHELSHYKRGDGLVNALLLALQTVYWFNPLTWGLFKLVRQDMELANDAAVLKNMNADEKKQYSISLVEVLAGYGKPALMPKLLCMVDSEKNIERRIKMIKLGEFFKKRKLIIAIASLLVIGVAGTLFLTVGRNTDIPPLYVSAINAQSIEAERFSYHWNFGRGEVIADAVNPTGWDYPAKNTITVVTDQELRISTQKGSREKNYLDGAQAVKLLVFNLDGTPYAGETDSTYLSEAFLIQSPKEVGTYIYTADIEYDRGTVTYGFKVVVHDDVEATAKRYALESGDKIGKMPEVVLYTNGEARLVMAAISSYLPPTCTYTIENDMLTLYAKIDSEQEAGAYGLANGDEVCTFTVAEGGNALLFKSAKVALFADEGARYVLIVPPIPDAPSGVNTTQKVKIEEYYGAADTAMELIYEDELYQYFLSSIRSDKIILNFENGDSLSLKAALQSKKINIESLIANGQQLWMYPKDNPLGGYFNIPTHQYTFSIDNVSFTPSASFMYTVEKSDVLVPYYALDELLYFLEQTGHKEKAEWFRKNNPGWERDNIIGGHRYLNQSELESIDIQVNVGWFLSSHTPVSFWVGIPNATSFVATVLENTQGYFLVEPVNGSNERKSSDKIVVAAMDAVILNSQGKAIPIEDIAVGARVSIVYTGLIAESYPAHITGIQIQVLN